MITLSALFYFISLSSQLFAIVIAISLVKKTNSYRVAWIFLSAALILILAIKITSLFFDIDSNKHGITDGLLSMLFSLLLLIGIFGIKKSLIFGEQLNQKLTETNKSDYLTKALSPTELYARSELEVERAIRYKENLAFLMIDIDHFKKVNDQNGHAVGDQVLIKLVMVLKQSLRVNDFIGRVGGEEFMVVLPQTNVEEAVEVADRLRKYVATHACHLVKSKLIKITISIGVSVMDLKVISSSAKKIVDMYFDNADKAMYQAKKAGRDRVSLF